SFLRLYRTGMDAVPRDEARFWLYRVARNLALNEINRRSTQSRLRENVARMFHPQAIRPDQEVERAESNRLVIELLEALPEHLRAALLLREQEEMSYREIARVLNVS